METAANTPVKPGSKKKKIILIGLGAAAAGVLSYFGWRWWHNRKAQKEEDGGELPSPPSKDSFSTGSDAFPLKKGSKGTKVRIMQKALISKYGKSILPRYGADGDFGNETAAALKKAGLPAEVDEASYNSLVQSLAGVTDSRIITTEAAYVWANPKEAVKVPSNMILGTELDERSGYTLFENDGRRFLIKTKSVKQL